MTQAHRQMIGDADNALQHGLVCDLRRHLTIEEVEDGVLFESAIDEFLALFEEKTNQSWYL